jgi:hypothetical protein
MVRTILSDRLNTAWHSFPWPVLVMYERRQRLEDLFYFAISYEAGDQVVEAVSNRCFVAVALVPDNAPPPPASTHLWASLGTLPYEVTNDPLQKFNVGDRVLNQHDGRIYYCIQDGSFFADVGNNLRFYPLPDFDPAFPLSDTFQKPMEEVHGVFRLPPGAGEFSSLGFTLVDAAVRVEGDPGTAWFRYRLQCPILNGDPWDEEVPYDPGEQIYFTWNNSVGTGEFYDCLLATNAGESPASRPEAWRRVEIPYIFGSHLQWAVHADWYELDGQQEKASATAGKAFERLQLEFDKIERQQRQSEPWAVSTR